jgi:aspartyl-tRNA(Asn)/glutamyl-tRNA(Gln) amidotransferase subunit B
MANTEPIFKATIGLEVHAQIASQSKLFSGAPSDVFGAEPNACVSFIDAAFPGMLPVVNLHCIQQGIRLGLGVKGKLRMTSIFERKHYFYPDLPQGYQISQFKAPLVEGGGLMIQDAKGHPKYITLDRIHLEQDAGQSIHDKVPHHSCLNFNRAGIGLMEIVSNPDLTTPEEVVDYVKRLRSLMRYLGVCQGNMEKGQLRVDANVSVHRPSDPLGTRVEIKNLNSISSLQKALHYEIQRQIQRCSKGEPIFQETRSFDVQEGITRPLRTKEEADDYRYFPDPDLPSIVLSKTLIETIAKSLPELPQEKYQRFIEMFELSPYDAALLTEEQETAFFFESTLSHLRTLETDPLLFKLTANWMTGEVFAMLKRTQQAIASCPVSSKDLASLIYHVYTKALSNSLAKDVFTTMWETKESPEEIMERKNLRQVSDDSILRTWIRSVLEQETLQVQAYFSGKEKIFAYLVGQIMKISKGKGNPSMIHTLLKEELEQMRSRQ